MTSINIPKKFEYQRDKGKVLMARSERDKKFPYLRWLTDTSDKIFQVPDTEAGITILKRRGYVP